MENDILELAARVGKLLEAKGLLLATAESCTGGGISQAITEIPGSTVWFERGFVTYSNAAKT
ncbi:MAG: CinA family protein, partial [Telluria sp.]